MNEPGRRAVCLGGGAAIGFAVWAASATLTGTPEPWDSNFWLYVIGLSAPAAVLAFIVPKHFGSAYLGIWAGQVIGMATVAGFDWFVLGIISTAIGSLAGLGGYAGGSVLRGRVSQQATVEPPKP